MIAETIGDVLLALLTIVLVVSTLGAPWPWPLVLAIGLAALVLRSLPRAP